MLEKNEEIFKDEIEVFFLTIGWQIGNTWDPVVF